MSNTDEKLEENATSSISEAPRQKTKNDFSFEDVIGEGSYSTVHLAKDRRSGKLIAIKECLKSQIVREKKVKYVHLEKKILSEYLNGHHFFVSLCCTFQDDDCLYFGLSYCPNGDLLSFIKQHQKLSLNKAKFYSAEIVEALEFMHSKKVIHRDIKPENILLDENFHIKISDFGSARILDYEDPRYQTASRYSTASENKSNETIRRRNSFVGTAQFVSPEVLQGKEPHIGSDLWALGCVIYQMLTGKHLFTGGHEYDIFQKVTRLDFSFPDEFPQNAEDLVKKLVVSNPDDRLGASEMNGYDKLKSHQFFELIEWSNLIKQNPPS